MEYPEKRLYPAANLYFLTPMHIRSFILIAIVALSSARGVRAQEPQAQVPTLGLQAAIQAAVENNFGLALSRDQTEAATVNRIGGTGSFMPSANASVSNSGRLGSNASGETSLGASASWLIFNGFQDYNGYRRLQAQEKSAQLEERQSLESLLETVVVSYYDIVQLKQRLAAIRQLLAVSQERATLSQARLEVGAGSRLDQLQSLADLNEDSSTYLNSSAALAQAKVRLNQVLAREASLDFDVADTIPLEAAPPLEDWRKGLPDNNATIAAARMNRNAAASGLAAARGRWLPSLNTGVSYNTTPEAFNSGPSAGSEGWRYNVNLSIPLFDRLGTPTAVRSAKLGLRSGETRVKLAESQTASDFAQARSQFETAMRRISLEERNLQVSRLQAEAAQERYKLGASSPLEFRDAQTRLLDAEGRLISARQSAKQSEAALQRISGVLIRQSPAGGQSKDADSAGGK
jgi:outer membrane protein